MSKLAFRAQTVDIAYLPLRQGFFGKKRFNDRSKGFPFGQQPVKPFPMAPPWGGSMTEGRQRYSSHIVEKETSVLLNRHR
jgi:hypothetical protein